jgi:hypothetical protein
MATRKNRRNCKPKTRKTRGGGSGLLGWFSSTPTADGTTEKPAEGAAPISAVAPAVEPAVAPTVAPAEPPKKTFWQSLFGQSSTPAPSNPTGVQSGGRRRKSRSRSTRRRRAFGK